MSRSCEEDPAFDYLLMLFLETTAEPLTVLPTHRLVSGLGSTAWPRSRPALGELFDGPARPIAAELVAAFGGPMPGPRRRRAGSGSGRAAAARS